MAACRRGYVLLGQRWQANATTAVKDLSHVSYCTNRSIRSATAGLSLFRPQPRSAVCGLSPTVDRFSAVCRRWLSVDTATEPSTDCESCSSLAPRPAHSVHAVLITDSAAVSWPARFSTSDAPPPLALCAAIDAAQKRRLRATASATTVSAASTPASASASVSDRAAAAAAQPQRVLASIARVTRHSLATASLQSATAHAQHGAHNRQSSSGWLSRLSSVGCADRVREGDVLLFPQRLLLRRTEDGSTVQQQAEAV